jgi:hypothetical protein
VDIEEHLRLHKNEVRELALEWANYDQDDADEAEQVIMVLMWERHESGTYDHHRPNPYNPQGYVSLLGYLRPYLQRIVLEEISKYKHFEKDEKGRPLVVVVPNADNDEEGITNFEGLQEQALEQGRDRVYLDSLYESPIPGLKTPLEDTLTLEDRKRVEKLRANLTDEEIAVLVATAGRSERMAAEHLGMAWTTYWRKLQRVRAKAEALVGAERL